MDKKTLIIGAGPAGLSCAYRLLNNNKRNIIIIIEKSKQVGGLAKTLIFKEGNLIFRTDIGPHRFFSKNPELYKMIGSLLGKDWIKVKRFTRQYIEGKFYNYPINFIQAFKNVGLFRAINFGVSYINGWFKYKVLNSKISSFEDFIIANFGKELGKFNMLNYTQKVWGIPCNKLHPDWGTQRIKGLNLISTLKNAIFKTKGPKTLVDEFYYPKYGTGTIYEKMANFIKKSNKIKTKSYPLKVYHKNIKY